MINVLVVEDDFNFNRAVCSNLINNGYSAIGCTSGNDALSELERMNFDIIISDIMMKGMDGFEFAEQVRSFDKEIPIIFLTAKDDLSSKEKGYKLNIDDYVVKPVDIKELIMRIEAVLRRANIANQKRITIGNLELDSEETAAYVDGVDIGLSVKEFNILFKLLSYPKRTFTRTQLMNDFWGLDTDSAPRTVDVCITKLRNKLSVCSDVEIVTVHGLGYKAVVLV